MKHYVWKNTAGWDLPTVDHDTARKANAKAAELAAAIDARFPAATVIEFQEPPLGRIVFNVRVGVRTISISPEDLAKVDEVLEQLAKQF